METRRLEVQMTDVEVRSEEGKPPVFVGYAVVYNADGHVATRNGSFVERILPGAFQSTLNRPDAEVRALVDHDAKQPLGRRSKGTLSLSSDDKGIRVEITPPNTTYAHDTMELVKRGDKVGMSFAFTVSPKGDRWRSNGGVRIREVSAAELHEVSIVTDGAYRAAYVEARNEEVLAQGLLSLAETRVSVDTKKEKELTSKKVNTRKETVLGTQERKKMTWIEIKKLEEQRAALFAKAAEIREAAKAADNRELTDEENEKHDTALVEAEKMTPVIDREKRAYLLSEKMNTRVNVFEQANPAKMSKDELNEKRSEAFDAYLRRGQGYLTSEQRSLLSMQEVSGQVMDEQRSLTVGGIGVVGPRDFGTEMVKVLKSFDGARQAGAKVLTTSHGNPFTYSVGDDTGNTGELLGEGEATNQDTSPTISNVVLNAYKYSSKVIKVSIELLQDEQFDLQGYIAEAAGERIGRIFNTHATTGDNSNKPNGVITALCSGNLVYNSSPYGDFDYFDELVATQDALDPAYRDTTRNKWMFHSTVLTAIRQAKDDVNRPLLDPNGAAPDKILGSGYVLNNAMPALTTQTGSTVHAVYGDFSKYVIRDVAPPVVMRMNELYAANGQVGFVVFSRHDGEMLDCKAFAGLRIP